MQKNVAGQQWIVFAFDRTDNTPKTGDAANITANLRIDGGAANAVDDTNPTELEDGYYVFDLSQTETNGALLLICPASSTADIQVIGCPATLYTTPPNFPALGIESDGDVTKVNTLDGHTVQTGDAFARLGAPAGASVSADVAAVKTETGTIVTDTNELQTDLTDGGRLDLLIDAIKARTDNLPDDPADDSDIDAQLATIAGYLDTEIAAILADTNALQTDLTDGGRLDLLIDAIKAKTDTLPAAPAATGDIPASSAIAAAVWDETLSGHLGAGSTGNALNAAGSAGDPWSTALPGAYGEGTAGKIVGDNINATVSSRSSHDAAAVKTAIEAGGSSLAQILADTSELQTDLTDGGRLDLLVDAIKAKSDNLPASPAATGAAMTLTSGERTTLAAALEAAMINELDGQAVMQAIADLIASDMNTTDLTVVAIATAVRDGILDRVLAGNHDTANTTGKLLQNLDAAVSTRSSHAAAAVKTALEAGGSSLAQILEDTGTTLPSQISGLNNVSAAQVRSEIDANSTQLTAIKAVTDKVDDTLEDDGGTYRFTENALEQAPSGGGGGGDATAANQVLLLEDLADVKGTGFVKDTNSLTNLSSASPLTIVMTATDTES